MIFDRFRLWRLERRWKKYGRKKVFTWIYRYLRLHKELLEDPVYRDMYDFHRTALVDYRKKQIKRNVLNDEQLGELLDATADTFNREFAERVNAYEPLVEDLYRYWKKYHVIQDR